MLAKIYRPAKTAMQSGKAGTKTWVLEFEAAEARRPDPLMGWTSSGDMNGQIRLSFETREAAVAYAKKHGIAHRVVDPQERRLKPKAYSDNFSTDRKEPWTH